MRKQSEKRKQLLWGIYVCILMGIAFVYLGITKKEEVKEVSSPKVVEAPKVTTAPTPTAQPTPTPDPTEGLATYFQGPRCWNERREWSGEWGEAYYDGGSFGGFGCGLCCMANVYCSFTEYQCSPVDMYKYAKKKTFYSGGGAIDWGYMKQTLKSAGFTCDVWRKPSKYKKFQEMVKNSLACIVVVSSYNSECYWKDTPGHYVTLFLYDETTDKVFLGDSGDPEHNRQWVPLKKIYRSLKTANRWQYLQITDYEKEKDKYRHKKIGGNCVLPKNWKK